MPIVNAPTDAELLALLWDGCTRGNVKASSCKIYESNVRAIARLVNANCIYEALTDFEKTKKAIERHHPTPAGSLFKVTAAVVALKACLSHAPACTASALQSWEDLQSQLNSARNELAQDNRMSTEDTANMVPLEDVAHKAAALAHTSYAESRDKVILTIAAHVFAKRAEWGTVRVVSDVSQLGAKENGMLLTPTTCKLILSDFKTVSSFGRYEEDMPTIVGDVIRESMKRFPRTYLVQRVRTEEPVQNKRYSELLLDIMRKHLKRDINVDRLRRMWVCQRVDYNTLTIAETNAIARKMLHSPAMQRHYNRVPAKV